MSDISAPIQIPCELNVPEAANDNESEQNESTEPAPVPIKIQSADTFHQKQLPKHRLRNSAKSHSLHTFPVSSLPIIEKTNEQNAHTQYAPPTITLSPASSIYRGSGNNRSINSLDRSVENRLMGDQIQNPSLLNTDQKSASSFRKRVNSLPVSIRDNDDEEFDDFEPNKNVGSQLRIRSSIISLFGRMGKMRRTSIMSQSSVHENGNVVGSTEHVSTLRNLPQIAATKILRAFSYVGKRDLDLFLFDLNHHHFQKPKKISIPNKFT